MTSESKVLILHFHGLGAPRAELPADEWPYWCAVDRFKKILDRIRELSARRPIVITFDDGNLSDLTVAAPELRTRGMSGEFFICSDRLGKRDYLSAADLRELHAMGMGVGSHGANHVDWRKVDATVLDDEIAGARHRLSDALGAPIDTVSIPFGSYDRRVIAALRRQNFKTVYTSDGGLTSLGRWLQPREVFHQSWDDDKTLMSMAFPTTGRLHALQRGLVCAAKRWR